jgi:predicted amidohydrolase YtcJ
VHARLCRNAGVTTATELAGMMLMNPKTLETWRAVTDDEGFPVRMVVYNLAGLPGTTADPDAVADSAVRLQSEATDKLRNGGVKLLLDGSIQGWTAMLQWPGYFTGTDHGQLLMAPEQVQAVVRALHRRRVNIHAHCNGNLATEVFLDAVEDALCDHAWLDHRHTVQHSQTSTPAQYRRMGRLGMCANIFTNHIWHWGDAHAERTLGPDRARGMWACRTALDAGVPLSFHSDSGVTPIGHLSTMWCAVNRTTPSGRVLGPDEAITPAEALRAATLGAAYQLHLDHEIGSIETGKRADFAVLDQCPLEVDPMAIRDIPVWGTVVGGVPFEAERPGRS